MTLATVESGAKGKTDVLSKVQSAAETVLAGNADALTTSGQAATAAFQDLAKAYQDLATRNAANLTEAIKALLTTKNPADLFALQQKLLADGVQVAVSDSQTIARLTVAVFNAAFEPVKAQVEALQKSALSHVG
jgi:hypothetical protein